MNNAEIQVGKFSELEEDSVFLKCQVFVLVENYNVMIDYAQK